MLVHDTDSRRWRYCVAALALNLVSAVAGAQVQDNGPFLHASNAAAPEPTEIVRQFRAAKTSLRETSGKFADVPATPEAVVDVAGKDPANLWQWVRDNTAFVSYEGVLRGARGVLADRDGNSLDRALLLAELLSVAGYETRLAWAQLDGATMAALAGDASLSRPRISLAAIGDVSPRIGRARERTVEQRQQLLQRVGDAARVSSRDSAGSRVSHWWVQVGTASGGWNDLDPLAPGPGQVIVPSAATYAVEDLPDGLFHKVAVRLILETGGDEPGRHLVLETIRRADEVAGRTLHVGHLPLGIASSALESVKTLEEAFEVMARAEAWLPLLSFDGQIGRGSMFTPMGEVLEATDENLRRYTGGAGVTGSAKALNRQFQGLADALGSIGKPGSASSGAAPPKPVDLDALGAEWLEISISGPGYPSETVRRTLFGKTPGGAAGNGVDGKVAGLLRSVHIAIETSKLTGSGLNDRLYRKLSGFDELAATLERKGVLTERDAQRFLPQLRVLQSDLDHLAWLRWKTNPDSDRVYIDRPNVTLFDRAIRRLPAGSWVAQQTIDIAFNPVRLRAAGGGDEFAVRLGQGVADTVAEALIYESSDTPVNSSVIHAIATERGVGLRRLGKGDADSIASLDLPSGAASLLRDELALGYTILLPERLIDLDTGVATWWRIDPRTGATLGMTSTGAGGAIRHVAASSFVEFVVLNSFLLLDVYFWADCVVGNQPDIFFLISIEGSSELERLYLCSVEAFAMNALAEAVFKLLMRNAGELARLLDDEAGSLGRQGPGLGGRPGPEVGSPRPATRPDAPSPRPAPRGTEPAPDAPDPTPPRSGPDPGPERPVPENELPQPAHRTYEKQADLSGEVGPIGMEEEHMHRFAELADSDNRYLIVRAANPESLKYHGLEGYRPKPLDVKFKTGEDGLVHVPEGPLSAADQAHLDELLAKGYRQEDDVLIDPYGNLIYGDYDMMGVYTSQGERIKLTDPEHPDPLQREAELDYLNERLFPDEHPMLQHGANDGYRFPDYDNPANVGGVPGRFPGSDERYIVFDPDGNTHVIEGTENLRDYYDDVGLVWLYD